MSNAVGVDTSPGESNTVIFFPAAFVWYLNIGGIYHAIKELSQKRKAVHT